MNQVCTHYVILLAEEVFYLLNIIGGKFSIIYIDVGGLGIPAGNCGSPRQYFCFREKHLPVEREIQFYIEMENLVSVQ